MVFSLTALLLLFFTIRISSLRRQYFLISDVVHEMQMEVLKAYALIETDGNGLNSQKSKQVEKAYANAESLINAMFYGGVSLHGFYLSPVVDQDILERLIPLKRVLTDLETLSKEYASTGNAAIQDIGRLKNDFLERAGLIDDMVEFRQSEREVLFRKISIAVLLIWGMLTGLFGLLLLRYERGERKLRDYMRHQVDFLQTLIDTIPAPVFYKDRRGRYLGCNRAFEEFLGIEKDEIRGKTVYDLAPSELAEIYFSKDEELFRNPGFQEYQSSVKDKEGLLRDVIFYKSAFLDDRGEVGGIIGVILDITERVRMEDELKGSRGRLEKRVEERTEELVRANRALQDEIAQRKEAERALQDKKEVLGILASQMYTILRVIPDHILLLTEDMRVKWSNRLSGKEDLMEWSAGNEGGYCYEILHGRNAPCEECPVLKVLETGVSSEKEIRAESGAIIRLRAYPIVLHTGRGALAVASDITEMVHLQRETLRTRHLSSIGELAAGVAHEINNPINGIINYAQIIRNRLPVDQDERDLAGRIIREGERVASVVKALLSFARNDSIVRRPVSLKKLLDESLLLLDEQMRKEGIEIVIDLEPALPVLKVDINRIEQVFLNILINSRYALNEKYGKDNGKKTIRIRATAVQKGGKRFVRVSFRDNGTGIPEVLLKRIYDPFFTTKPPGRGTGLGLSISHGIIAEHGGRMFIKSREGEFTEVSVDLPCPVQED